MGFKRGRILCFVERMRMCDYRAILQFMRMVINGIVGDKNKDGCQKHYPYKLHRYFFNNFKHRRQSYTFSFFRTFKTGSPK